MFTFHRHRIYPNAEQRVLLAKHFGCVRWVYNNALALKQEAWEKRKERISHGKLCARLPILKKEEPTAWLAEVNAQSLQSSLAHLDTAFTNFFRKNLAFPRFKSRHDKQSFQVPQLGVVGANFVKIPKIGKIPAVISRGPAGKSKTIVISQTPTGKYFASVLYEHTDTVAEPKPIRESTTVGIDLGLKTFAVLSTGEKVTNPRHYKKALKKLRRKHRQVYRSVSGSKNRNKRRLAAARVHEKVVNQRNDFLHKLTTKLVRDNQTDSFAIEDLSVSNMVKNKKLAQSIGQSGWGNFRRFLTYKAERAGKNVLVIGRFEPSSRACSCGIVNKDLKLSDRVWTCECGLTHDRDVNAARNIKRFALHPQNFVGRGTPKLAPAEIS